MKKALYDDTGKIIVIIESNDPTMQGDDSLTSIDISNVPEAITQNPKDYIVSNGKITKKKEDNLTKTKTDIKI